MTSTALVITYHAVDASAGPLSVEPALLREHLDVVDDAGARTLTISELAAAIRGGSIPDGSVALTFDDAFASVIDEAAPLLAERGQRATVFAVTGAIGARNVWPSQPPGAPTAPLADLDGLRALASAGWEIGSHGHEHAPLGHVGAAAARRELVDSRARLEQALGISVGSLAFPYGDLPRGGTARLVRETYTAACTTRLAYARPATDPWMIPRVDAHYVRRPEILRRVVEGSAEPYLRARGLAARARRVIRKDFVEPPG